MTEQNALINEVTAWRELCRKIQNTFNISQKEFNDNVKIKELVKAIEQWGYYEYKRRIDQKDTEKKGLFWDGIDQ